MVALKMRDSGLILEIGKAELKDALTYMGVG